MNKYIIEFDHLEYRSGSGYDSNSGMTLSGGYDWKPQVWVFNSEEEAKSFYNARKSNDLFYKNWKFYKGPKCELVENFNLTASGSSPSSSPRQD